MDIVTIPETVFGQWVGNLFVSSYPTIVVDPASGYIYVAFTNNDNKDYDIDFTRSTDGGASWGPPYIPTQTYAGQQFSPWLSVSSSGTLSLVYYQGSNNSVDVYVAESYNSGQSFYGSDIRVTPNSFNPSTSTWTSEYNGMVSTPFRNVFPIWTYTGTDDNISTALYNSATRLAYNNVSFSSSATWYNNNHTLERGSDGKLHEVFVSGGEILYRQSTNNGSSWNVTTMLSSGNGSNDVPSIVHGYGSSTDNLVAVWQRESRQLSISNLVCLQHKLWRFLVSTIDRQRVFERYCHISSKLRSQPVVGSFFYEGQEGTAAYIAGIRCSGRLSLPYSKFNHFSLDCAVIRHCAGKPGGLQRRRMDLHKLVPMSCKLQWPGLSSQSHL